MYNMGITVNTTGSEPSREVMHTTTEKSLSKNLFLFYAWAMKNSAMLLECLKFHIMDSAW